MRKPLLMAAALDYYKTRRKLWRKLLIALVPALIAGLYLNFVPFIQNVDFSRVFEGFINVQISAVAILISFSIAIITILVSADNPNIKKLKETNSKESKPLRNGYKLNLFQVLLSNITYTVLILVTYLGFLIVCIFLRLYVDEKLYTWLMAICVFFIVHILHVLLESVGQMYMTFWKHEE